jgi:hypothetical protein
MQHAFSGRLSLDVAYVGNHGSRLTGIQDINQAALGSSYTADGNQPTRPFYAKYPYLEFINFYSNLYRSNYNGLQATFTGRNYHGLDVIVGYTYAHALDDQSYNWNQYLPKDSNNPNGEYGASDFDIRHRFTLSATYSFPNIKTWGQLLEGWQVNTILTLQTGQPWQSFDTSNDFSGTGEFADRWDFFGNTAISNREDRIPFLSASDRADHRAARMQHLISWWRHGTLVAGANHSPMERMPGAHNRGLARVSQFRDCRRNRRCYASLNGKSFLLPGVRHVWKFGPQHFPRYWLPQPGFVHFQKL